MEVWIWKEKPVAYFSVLPKCAQEKTCNTSCRYNKKFQNSV